MQFIKIEKLITTALLIFVGLISASAVLAQADEPRQPELPGECATRIPVEEGNRAVFHVYAIGVQIYRWNGVAWIFAGPVANLYADENFHGLVGTHFATPGGPAWETKSGSRVVVTKVNDCAPDAKAIPWLLLREVSTVGPGIFDDVTFVQRVDTTGGVAPSEPGSTLNELRRVPYTAQYFFYRASN